ncbi:hypothetical protein N6H14_28480 [Paenibacillus sp. CC-CFT747]|nr:hypothetical protein N6H14_28480 [Paenibacillus sp. CC-CFT747]
MTWLNKLRPVSFQRKLLGYSLIVSIVPVLLVGLLSSFLASRSLQNEVNGNHKYMLDQVEKQLSQFIASLRVSSINIATSLAVERTVRDGPSIDNLTNSLEMNETIRRIRSSSPIPYNVSMILRNHRNYLYSNAFETSSRPMQRLTPILDTWKPKANEPFLVPANTFDDQPDMLLYSPVPIQSSYTQGCWSCMSTRRTSCVFSVPSSWPTGRS